MIVSLITISPGHRYEICLNTEFRSFDWLPDLLSTLRDTNKRKEHVQKNLIFLLLRDTLAGKRNN